MEKTWPIIVRDPVHNIIPFNNNDCDKLLLRLIGTREFQRLRRIKQLGFSEFVFPGANHNRFAHSIGVMQTARLFLNRLNELTGGRISAEHQTFVLAAALLHDLGHGPFSHTFEKITGEDHESRTLEIIQNDTTEVHAALRAHSVDLPNRLALFFEEDVDGERLTKEGIPAYLTSIVSSQLDADRFDYLLRDSYSTGTIYGEFDLQWIAQHLLPDENNGRVFLSHKALFAAETYVFARHHMYQTVYFHKTTRAAEVMLRLLFKRYQELLRQPADPQARSGIVPDAPRAIVAAFSGVKLSLNDYLRLDDVTVVEFLKCCHGAADELIRYLGAGLLNRRLFKAIDVTHSVQDLERYNAFQNGCREKAIQLGKDPEYAFCLDSPADTPYKPYDPNSDEPATQIYVQNMAGEQKELGTLTEAVNALKKRHTLYRHYFPSEIRGDMERVAQATILRTQR